MNNFDPVIDVQDTVIMLGDAVSLSSISTVSDRDGDLIETYRFFDPTGGGFFTLDGVEQSSGIYFDVDASEFSLLRYHAGSTVDKEDIRAMVYDGERWSSADLATMYSVSSPSRAPNVQANNFVVAAYEKVQLANYFTAEDPDGYPIIRYKLRDLGINNRGGRLEYNGQIQKQGEWFYVRADKLDTLYYNGLLNQGSERILVRAFDGSQWSPVARMQANTTRNSNRPIIANATFTIRSETSVALIDTFEVRDEDMNTMKKYRFIDTNGRDSSGYIEINGVRQRSNRWITIDAEDMPNAKFVASQGANIEKVRVRAWDGKFWSQIKTVDFESLPDPTLNVSNDRILDEFEVVRMSDVVTGQADEGPRIVDYEFVDMNDDELSGYMELDGNRLAANVVHNFSQAEFARLNFVGGANHRRSLDQIKVRANNRSGVNSFFVGEWKNVNFYTEPNATTSFIMPNLTPDELNSWHDWITEQTNGRLRITYSFMQQVPIYYGNDGPDPPENPFPTPNTNQRRSMRAAMSLFEDLLNVDIVEVSDNFVDPNTGATGGMVRFGTYFEDSPVLAFAYAPDDTVFAPWGGDIWVNNFFPENVLSVGPDSPSFLTLLHEIGHAFGMAHPFEVGFGKTVLSAQLDHEGNTVMSYTPNPNGTDPRNLMGYDALFLGSVYGYKDSTRTGDDTYSWNAVRFSDLVYDAAGNDTIDASNQLQPAVIDLRQGQYSSIGAPNNNVTIAFGTVIENAIGTGAADTIWGNEEANMIWGGAGDDVMKGFGGDDTFYGGSGDDRYIYEVGDQHSIINEDRQTGRDILEVRLGNRFGLDNFTEDVSFQRLGRDLLVEFRTEGDDFRSGSMLIKNQLWGGSRVETLRLFNDDDTLNGVSIDLTSVFVQSDRESKFFEVTGTRGQYGFLVQPV